MVGRAGADTTLAFNEVMYHPQAGTNEATFEWVELYNQLGVDLDVSNWRLKGDIGFEFPANTRIPGRGFIVIAFSPTNLTQNFGITNVLGPVTNRLSNDGGTIEIYNQIGRLVDRINYSDEGDWPIAPDGSGVSLAKRDRDLGSGASANWTWSREVGGTPGRENFDSGSAPIAIASDWKYEASGSDLGTAWREPGYNDGTWSSRYNLTNRPVATLYNTGVGDNAVALTDGAADPHYILTAAAQGTVGANATVIQNHSAWVGNDSRSKWIGVVNPGTANVNSGAYNYLTRFSLEGFLPSTVAINLNVAVDDSLSDVLLNGVPTGANTVGFAAFNSAGTLRTGFNAGTNTLEFRTVNGSTSANPHGFRAFLTSSGIAENTNSPLPADRATVYFRKAFNYPGDPRFGTLTLNAVVADGAVFYLNGVEVHRQNMAAGTPTYTTTALANVAPAYTGPISLPVGALRYGTNVLAVEVHQADGSVDRPVLGVELSFTLGNAPLAFNEVSPTTNATTWLELVNYGTNALSLDGMIIHNDAVGTNYEYIIPAGTTIAAGGFLALSNSVLGFASTFEDTLILYTSNRLSVLDAVDLRHGAQARWPDATGEWRVPLLPTPGTSNSVLVRSEIVINEIMYNHHRFPRTNNLPPPRDPEAWIEFYNRSSNMVNLSGWSIDGGVSFHFTNGQVIQPGAYLVVADDAAAMVARYPGINVIGNLGGRLSRDNDKITLRDPTGNPADTVHYYSGGRWPEYADGGGSSLELRDPWADNSKPEAWASSDEFGKSVWQTFSYRMVAAPSPTAAPDSQWREFVFGLLGEGECLIDDISVIQSPDITPVQFIDNGNFENGITGWRILGTHSQSRVITEPGNPANHVLQIVASGPQEHMHNHIETTLSAGRTVANGQTYQISFRVRWINGNNLLNTRLYFNRCARTSELPRPLFTGTPGTINSRYVSNIGPTYDGFNHSPIVPYPMQAVTVSIDARDSQGVTNCAVWWSANGGAWSTAPMSPSAGVYRGTIPGFTAGTLVQFYVQAADALGAISMFPADGPNSGALYRVNDGLADMTLAHNLRILMSPANTALLHASTNVMSNHELPCTVIYDERRAYYDTRVRLKSSERGRDDPARVGFHLAFPPHDLFRDVHPMLLVDRAGGGGRPAQEEILIRHMMLKSGAYLPNPDICRILAPRSAQNGPAIVAPRFEDEFVESTFKNGGDGTLWELELIYYPTTTNSAGYKLPQPDNVQEIDISDVGNDKEAYRYNFIIKNHREDDNYGPFMTFAKIWSTNGAALEAGARMTMDIDEWMRAYAIVTLCGVSDMYTFGNNHNLITYLRPEDGRFLYFPWDMDFSFARAFNASLVGDMNFAKIVNLTPNLRRMYAHILDHINVSFNQSYMTSWAAHYGAFSGTDYSADLTYIQQRGDYAKSAIAAAGGNTAFAVAGAAILTNGSNLISLSGTAPISATSILVNGNAYPITWTTMSAWTILVPVSGASNWLEIAAIGLNGNAISNMPAIRTVYFTNAVPDPAQHIVFSEIMYNPAIPGAGYVELFNTSTNFVFDLSGWRIDGLDFTFPGGTILSNKQFLVIAENTPVYFATYGSRAGVPAGEYSGSLQANGERLTLLRPGVNPSEQIIVDRVRYEGDLPWPDAGAGASYQLVDFAQDNTRVANWGNSFIPASTNSGWRFVSVSTIYGPDGRMLIYLDNVGSVVIDELAVISFGSNYIQNGDFEQPIDTNIWKFGTNMTASSIISDFTHSGNGALRLVQDFPGSPTIIARDLLQTLSPRPTNGQPVTFSMWYYATNTAATNLTVRFVSNVLLSSTQNVRVIVTAATNVLTPNATSFMTAALPAFEPLWINELQAGNVSGTNDSFGQRDPWIEIYNPSANTVSLDGLYLSSDYASLTNWAFPQTSVIPPNGFMIVWCDGQPEQSTVSELHTSFRLTNFTGSVALSRLYNGVPQVLDYVNYKDIHPDRSYGSYPDGQPFDRMEFFNVTPGRTNNPASLPLVAYINEWMAWSTSYLRDPADDDFDDWFEIFNPGSNSVDIAGYFLTDSITNKFQYRITTNGPHIIPSGGHLLVWADDETAQNMAGSTPRADLHVNFQLRQTGEAIYMFAADGAQIDGVSFLQQTQNVSQGRYPDGGPSIVYMPGTGSPRSANYLGGTANTAPLLGGIGNKTVYAGQLLTFIASAIDNDAPPQVLSFSLDPGGPDGANITPEGSFSWTPIGSGVYSATIRVTDSGSPPISDSETITITVLNQPRFAWTARDGSKLELTWDTHAGQVYRVWYKNDLNAVNWTFLQEFMGTGSPLTITNNTGLPAQRFYQITSGE